MTKKILNMQQNGTSDKHVNCDQSVILAENKCLDTENKAGV